MNTRYNYHKLMEQIDRIRARYEREIETLAAMTGRTVAEVEADLAAPDPGLEDDDVVDSL